MENFKILSSNGKTQLECTEWKPYAEPKAILQIVHGMCEYVGRYDAFAQFLNKENILVVGDDHLGHGHSADEGYGYFGEQDGWKRLIDDECLLAKTMQEKYPNVPYILLGHSMGSFIARGVLATETAKTFSGAIIMGTAGTNNAINLGLTIIKLLRKIKGSKSHSKLITGMAFGSYLKNIENPVNNSAWLSHDDNVCISHATDPMCKFTFTLAGYEDLFRLLKYINSDEWYAKLPQNLPILVTSGWEDPVGDYGKGPAEVVEKIKKANCEVAAIFYEGMRHEILNEIGKETVYDDMLAFILDASEGVHFEKGLKPFCDFE